MTIEDGALVVRRRFGIGVTHGGRKGLILLDQVRAVNKAARQKDWE